MTKLAIGIIGSSWWVDTMYLPALQTHPHAEVRAICARRLEPLQALAKTWQIPELYTQVSDMLSQADLDVVIICSPNATHYDYTLQALEANAHVLCEKPLVLSYEQAKTMRDLANKKGLKTMTRAFISSIVHNRAVAPSFVEGAYIQALLDAAIKSYEEKRWVELTEIIGEGDLPLRR